jgi:hypothetical protein
MLPVLLMNIKRAQNLTHENDPSDLRTAQVEATADQ